jgi:hypothetical protein
VTRSISTSRSPPTTEFVRTKPPDDAAPFGLVEPTARCPVRRALRFCAHPADLLFVWVADAPRSRVRVESRKAAWMA